MELVTSLLTSLKAADPDALDQEYATVRSQALKLKKEQSLTTEVGALKDNIKKNRYKDILPFDQSRVVLSLLTTDSDSDYINASFIKGATTDRRYIACQGPLSSTLTDFWRMIWEHDAKVIVMACRLIEMGKKKCECYWAEERQKAVFGPFTVNNQGEIQPNDDVVVRNLTVTYQEVTRSVVQYQFLSWPDHDVPYEAVGVLDLLVRARNTQGAHTSPMVVHCSAGCGRTGVVCALDYIRDLLVTKQITPDFSIMKIVQDLRIQRPSAVQTKDQYRFIFTAVACMFERVLQATSRHHYSNVPEIKKPETKTTKNPVKPASSSKRSSQQNKPAAMNDTYAVVNKPRHPPSPSPTPAYSAVSRSSTANRSMPASHHYDNVDGAAAPLYSTVKPKTKPNTLPLSATPIYDTASASANHRPHSINGDYHLVSAERLPSASTDDDYEDFSTDVPNASRDNIGFNCRIQKPRGPRDPPAEWSRLER